MLFYYDILNNLLSYLSSPSGGLGAAMSPHLFALFVEPVKGMSLVPGPLGQAGGTNCYPRVLFWQRIIIYTTPGKAGGKEGRSRRHNLQERTFLSPSIETCALHSEIGFTLRRKGQRTKRGRRWLSGGGNLRETQAEFLGRGLAGG